MKMKFTEIKKSDNLAVFSDGLETIEYFDKVLSEVVSNGFNTFEESSLQPVSLLLLDINMPKMSGIEALKIIKQKYEQINAMYPYPKQSMNDENKVSING